MKKAVIAFGRFNPISIGHEKLANKIDSEAKKRGASARLYMSHSQDKKKNPLDYNTKINLGKRAFGKMVTKSSARNIIEILKQLESEGFTDVTIIGGSDRVPEFTTLVNKYNGKEYNIPTISVVSAGERDPDAEGVEGMSASKLRGLAQAGEFEKFKQGVPSKFSKNDILKMYNTIRSVMEEMEDDFTDQELDDFLEEIGNTLEDDDDSFEFDDEELDDEISEERKPLTLQQRMKRRMMFKRLAPRIQRARKIKARRMAQKPQLIKRSRKAALSLLKKRAAGDRGKNYAALSPSEKISVDRLVQRKLPMVDKIARRLLPKIQKKEIARLKSFRSNQNKNESFINEAFTLMLEEVSQSQLNDLEKFADRLLAKYNIDIEFTKHFADRMNDERNKPAVKISELQALFKKIDKNKGKNIHQHAGHEVVIKDMQKDLNLPVVIKVNKDGDLEVVHKTIMRKANFKTPDPVIQVEGIMSIKEYALQHPNKPWHSKENPKVIKLKKKGDMHHPSDPKDAGALHAVTGKSQLSHDELKYAHGTAANQGYKLHVEEVDPVEEGAALDMLKNRQDRENAARLRDARLKNRNTRVNELFIAFIQ
jgi:hypothetical protein